jgi:hypothetical protein
LKQRFVFGISFSQFEHLSGLAGLVAGMLLEDQRALSEGPSPAALRYIAQVLQSLDGSPRLTLTKPPRLREERKRSLNEGKLILVGRGEVGKTSLVRRLSENEFRGDESKTQGINITNWPLRCGSKTLRLNVWDFGGQEIMHATHQFFLTERSVYLLVLNGREGAEDFDAELSKVLVESHRSL